ncbi:MAG TPA: RHS repeat-associated core domain-containing protein, partial [Chloroflexota bacterium]|nr:RHS repeat-associated core domain-containing protein [Chloroflexota bacterium]
HYGVQAGSNQLEVTESYGSGLKRVVDYDSVSRTVQQRSVSRKDGQAVLVDFTYDDLGHGLSGVSRPHFIGDTPVFSKLEYDNLGRLRFRHGAEGGTIELRYSGLKSERYDAKTNRRAQTTDQSGRIVASVEPGISGDVTTTYRYGPFDVLRSMTDFKQNTITVDYDRLGRKIHYHDPDAGQHDYTYTAFGDQFTEVVNGTDTTTHYYDTLGRRIRTENKDGTTKWTWDTAPHGVGLLAQTTSPDSVVTDFGYDNSARLSTTKWTAAASTGTIERQYDPLGRLKTLLYPDVAGRGQRFGVDYVYAPNGDLDSVVDHASASSANPYIYYAVLENDDAGQPTNPSGGFPAAKLGNGITTRKLEDPTHLGYPQAISAVDAAGIRVQRLDLHFDLNGNLDHRGDSLVGTTESFTPDANDRLRVWSWTANGTTRDTTFGYDDLDNFLSRTVTQNPAANVTYTYDGTAGPHGVTARNGQSYGYDGRGRQSTAPGRTVDFTQFDLPKKITAGNSSVGFAYDADRQRVLKTGSDGSSSFTVGAGLYEQRIIGGTTSDIFTIQVRGVPVAQVISRGGTDTIQYLHLDHLGSVDTVTDSKGAVVERLKYDPFGQRVTPSQLDQPLASPTPERFGFTGHEHDDDLGLINMKGRVYDPLLGRFLTSDPFVNELFRGQAYDRFAYVDNNPTSVVGPTGFVTDGDVAGIIGGWPVSGWISSSSANRPQPQNTRPPRTQQPYDPRDWNVIQLEIVPDSVIRSRPTAPRQAPDRVANGLDRWDRVVNWVSDHPYQSAGLIFGGVFVVGVGVGVVYGLVTGTLGVGYGTATTIGLGVGGAETPRGQAILNEGAEAISTFAEGVGAARLNI